MAESISEGTLRSWSKQVGDTVEADEEIATIETDKVRTQDIRYHYFETRVEDLSRCKRRDNDQEPHAA